MRLQPMICTRDGTQDTSLGLFFVLDPTLQIGVDANVDQAARLQGRLDLPLPRAAGYLAARLSVYDPLQRFEEELFIDDLTTLQPFDTTTGPSSIELDLEVKLPPELDHLPPSSSQNLLLVFALCEDLPLSADAPQRETIPSMPHGASLQLPFNEFHDILPIAASNGPRLQVVQPQQREAAPGATVQWEVVVDGEAATYAAELFGVSKGLGRLSSEQVEPGDSLGVTLELPADARPGDVLELILSVAESDNAVAAAAVRLTVLVDPAAPVETLGAASDGQDAPNLPAALVLLVLALATHRQRRR
jgi:MYXO-CTERM domain-containing protein